MEGRALAGALILMLTLTPGCQDADPSRTIVNLQLDYDGETAWVYIYTSPRARLDNLTLTVDNITLCEPHVYSLQQKTTSTNIEIVVVAELQAHFWGFNATVVFEAKDDQPDEYRATAYITHPDGKLEQDEWGLPHSQVMERLP